MLREPDDYVEEREGGKLVIFKRGGIFQARIYRGKGSRGYIYKSLSTRNLDEARKAATKHFHQLEFKAEHGLPLVTYTVSQVINEYVAMREKDHEQAKRSARTFRFRGTHHRQVDCSFLSARSKVVLHANTLT